MHLTLLININQGVRDVVKVQRQRENGLGRGGVDPKWGCCVLFYSSIYVYIYIYVFVRRAMRMERVA